MTNDLIKQKIEDTLLKVSKQRLADKIKAFERVDIPLISVVYRKEPVSVSRKQLRLYLDLIDTWYPIYRNADNKTKADFIAEVFKCECSLCDLERLKSFKEITKKKVVTAENENVKTISRLRWRSRDHISKNIIHFRK